jgi:uncharacterized protein YjbJ (UPF0337 family)
MDTRILNRTWGELRGKLKQRYGQLKDEDLVLVEGGENELMKKLQQKLGKSWKELNALLADLLLSDHEKGHTSGAS